MSPATFCMRKFISGLFLHYLRFAVTIKGCWNEWRIQISNLLPNSPQLLRVMFLPALFFFFSWYKVKAGLKVWVCHARLKSRVGGTVICKSCAQTENGSSCLALPSMPCMVFETIKFTQCVLGADTDTTKYRFKANSLHTPQSFQSS